VGGEGKKGRGGSEKAGSAVGGQYKGVGGRKKKQIWGEVEKPDGMTKKELRIVRKGVEMFLSFNNGKSEYLVKGFIQALTKSQTGRYWGG